MNTEQLKNGVFYTANDAVLSARDAYKRYSKLNLSERKEITEVIRQRVLEQADVIADLAVKETGMGNVEDKAEKLIWAVQKTPGIEDLVTEVRTDDSGMTLYELSPYGVVCAVYPVNNPAATLVNNTICALSAGNSIINCPHPRAKGVSIYLTNLISSAILDVCGIDNLVTTIMEPSMQVAQEIMRHPDVSLVSVTGGTGVLQEAVLCGKRMIGGGSANPVVIVDETADIRKAARDIVAGASFDNNIMCTSEKSIVVVKEVAKEFISELLKNKVFYVKNQEYIQKIANVVLTDNGLPNKAFNGKSPSEILRKADIMTKDEKKLIVLESTRRSPFVINEMLMPLIPLVVVEDFEEALEAALEIEQNFRHTAIIHSQSIERLNRAAKEMQTAVFVKNAPSFAGIGFRSDGETSFTVASATGEGTITPRHYARRRRCVLMGGFSIR